MFVLVAEAAGLAELAGLVEEVEDAVLEPAVDDVDELELTSDLPAPYVPEAPRLPRSCGAISAANRSALTIPLTRMVRSRSPVRIAAVRSDEFSALAASSLALDFTNHARPATVPRASAPASQRPRPRGFSGTGRRTSGSPGRVASGAAFRTEALLM